MLKLVKKKPTEVTEETEPVTDRTVRVMSGGAPGNIEVRINGEIVGMLRYETCEVITLERILEKALAELRWSKTAMPPRPEWMDK